MRGHGKVLVMDDEDMVRQLVGQMLERLGYEVELAKDGAEVIERYRHTFESGNPFDAVILDLTVSGGMGGKEAINKLLAVDAKAKAIVSSGYSNDPIMADFDKFGFLDVIPKPYEIEPLSRVLNKVVTMAR